jgi:hypothetical protein
MERNIKEFLRKNKLVNKSEIQLVIAEFYKMLNSMSEMKFIETKNSLNKSEKWSGAMREEKVQSQTLYPKLKAIQGDMYVIKFYCKVISNVRFNLLS